MGSSGGVVSDPLGPCLEGGGVASPVVGWCHTTGHALVIKVCR